jgi:hypothetical protein
LANHLSHLYAAIAQPDVMNSIEREPFLLAIDSALAPLAFKRPKTRYEWRRKVDRANTTWLHINFCLGVINPSFGIQYTDLAGILPPEAGAVDGVNEMLSSSSGMQYSNSTPADVLAEHVLAYAVPRIDLLADRHAVIQRLESSSPKDWPVFGVSWRMRLLPLLLATDGRTEEAFAWLAHFENTSPLIDQKIPPFDVFAQHFRQKYGGH